MKINKILNNNVVVVKEGHDEIIVIGPGIAFGKRKNDIINSDKIEKVFVMKDEKEYEKFTQIIDMLPEEHISLAEEIITHAEKQLRTKLNEHIHVGLTDHLSFAIERVSQGFELRNKLLHEIKVLYDAEFNIGLWALELVSKKTGITLPEDEAAHIALHLHTAKMNTSTMSETLNTTVIINELIKRIEEKLSVKLAESSISYQRLITHLNFALKRVIKGEAFEDIDEEMYKLVRERHADAYKMAVELAQFLYEKEGMTLPNSEIVYLTLHIQRIQRN
ncbi:PRD domain-containing protein [Halalkalibacter urbisdiaboli]|uniref:PRD domain-containing protein n=1 Tax=Halalkalibacter urbisdiaboli TaxID=1960589 RepID=UPI000B448C80|nr:PRD domain-containing protein [Halalkalibacter urbisdiaboli]